MFFSSGKLALAATLALSALSGAASQSLAVDYSEATNEGNDFLLVTSSVFFYEVTFSLSNATEGEKYTATLKMDSDSFVGELHDLSLSSKERLPDYRTCDERLVTQESVVLGEFRAQGVFSGERFNTTELSLNSTVPTKTLCYSRKGGIVGQIDTGFQVVFADENSVLSEQDVDIKGEFRLDDSLFISTAVSGVLGLIVVLRCSMDCAQHGCTRQYPEWDEETRLRKEDE